MTKRFLGSAALLLMLTSTAAVCHAAETGTDSASSGDALQMQRSEFIAKFRRIGLNTAPEDAQFLQLMVGISGAKPIDIDPKMVARARENIAQMQLEKSVSVMEGDALEVIPKLQGKFDFAFIDAVKKDYLRYFQGLEPLLEPGALIIADNVIQSAKDMQDFLTAVRENPNYRMVIVRASELKKDGMAIIHKLK